MCAATQHMCFALSLLVCLSAASIYTDGGNKFGVGVYGQVPWREQLPWALNLTGPGGRVLLFMTLSFAENGNATSCGECVPPAEDTAALHQAYAMGLRPVVRLGQYPRTIRDFSDDADEEYDMSLGMDDSNSKANNSGIQMRDISKGDGHGLEAGRDEDFIIDDPDQV